MKRFYFDCRLAKILLAFSSCHTITLGPFVLSKRKEENVAQSTKNHETCHAIQWIETASVSGMILLLLQIILGFSGWWILSAGLVFYIWYGLEFLVRLAMYREWKKAYKNICFEREAYGNQYDSNYIENREMFAFCTKYFWYK